SFPPDRVVERALGPVQACGGALFRDPSTPRSLEEDCSEVGRRWTQLSQIRHLGRERREHGLDPERAEVLEGGRQLRLIRLDRPPGQPVQGRWRGPRQLLPDGVPERLGRVRVDLHAEGPPVAHDLEALLYGYGFTLQTGDGCLMTDCNE